MSDPSERRRARTSVAAFFVGGFAAALAGCHERSCDVDLLPGVCASGWSKFERGVAVVDAVLIDIDGDEIDEVVAIDGEHARLSVHWSDGSTTVRPLELVPQAIAVGDFDGDGVREVALAGGESTSVDLGRIDLRGDLTSFDHIEAGEGIRDLWAGDLDGDGIDEVVTVDAGDGSVTVIHGGDRASTTLATGGTPTAVDVADLDGDGALDLVVADFTGGALIVFQGHAGGGFAEPRSWPSVAGLQWIDLGDVDGDGHVDIAARGGAAPEVWVHPGDGAGAFDDPFAVAMLPEPVIEHGWLPAVTRGVGVAILPAGPGELGAILVPEAGQLSSWRIAADRKVEGRVALATSASRIDAIVKPRAGVWIAGGPFLAAELQALAGPMPVEVWRAGHPDSPGEHWGRVAIGDLDGDGIDDLAAIHSEACGDSSECPLALEIRRGDGDGGFELVSSALVEGMTRLGLADVDGGGLPVLLREGSSSIELCRIEDAAEGKFVPVVGADGFGDITEILRGDDGRDRALLWRWATGTSREYVVVTLTRGGAVERTQALLDASVASLAGVDIDGDGDDDLVATLYGEFGPSLQAWTTTTQGALAPGPKHEIEALTGWRWTYPAIGAGDIDGDGATEVLLVGETAIAGVVGIDGPAPSVRVDDGLLMKSPPNLGTATVGDVDGDGQPDLLFPRGGELQVLRSEGGAWAGPAATLPMPSWTRRVHRDLDGDGRLDTVATDSSFVSAFVMRSGVSPRLRTAPRSGGGLRSTLVGDVDGDGLDDLVSAALDGISVIRRPREPDRTLDRLEIGDRTGVGVVVDLDHDGRDEVVLRSGAVRLDEDRLRLDPLTFAVDPGAWPSAAGDLDGDGAIDLVFANYGANASFMLSATFAEGADRFGAPHQLANLALSQVAVADLNRDGRGDVIAVAGGETAVFWSRPERSFEAVTMPVEWAVVLDGGLLTRSGSRIDRIPIVVGAFGASQRVVEDPRLVDSILVAVGDLDGDGRGDLASVTWETTLIWLARGDGLMLARDLGPQPSTLVAGGDLDGDGLGELVGVVAQDDLFVLWGDWR